MTRRELIKAAVLFALISPLTDSSGCRAVEFQRLGTIDNRRTESMGYTVSGNGRVVFGFQQNNDVFRWTEGEGMRPIGRMGVDGIIPFRTTFDGTIGIGFGLPGMWTKDRGIITFPGFWPGDASYDASVIIGLEKERDLSWKRGSSAVETLVENAFALAISGDGNVAFGRRREDNRVFRWAAGKPLVELWTSEWGGPFHDASRDGSVFVGTVVEEGSVRKRQAYRWSDTEGATSLPDLGAVSSGANGVSADGTIIVGDIAFEDESRPEAVLWDERRQLYRIQDLLIQAGIELGDFQLTHANGISHDGTVIVGTGALRHGTGRREAWRADCYPYQDGDFDKSRMLDLADINRLIEAQHTTDEDDVARYDLNSDRMVNFADVRIWVEDLAQIYFGDANLDGKFHHDDLLQVFQAGEYDDGVPDNSTWSEGDWDGNLDFDSDDLLLAFESGRYELGPRMPVAAVPEPVHSLLTFVIATWTVCRHRRWHRDNL